MFTHRMLAIVVGALFVWCLVRARTMRPRSPRLVRLATIMVVLLGVQILVGGANVLTELAAWARGVPRGDVGPDLGNRGRARGRRTRGTGRRRRSGHEGRDTRPIPRAASLGDTVRAYVALTKPRIIVLLLIITVPAMVLAAGAVPSLWLVLATLVGGTLAAGAANAMNMYLDRDIDQVMQRTRSAAAPPARGLARGGAAVRLRAGGLRVRVLGDHRERARRPRWPSPRSPSTSSSTRCGSSARPTRTSSSAARPARCPSWSGGRRSPARSRCPRSCCSRSSSSGRRRTSGRSPCGCARTTPRPACR